MKELMDDIEQDIKQQIENGRMRAVYEVGQSSGLGADALELGEFCETPYATELAAVKAQIEEAAALLRDREFKVTTTYSATDADRLAKVDISWKEALAEDNGAYARTAYLLEQQQKKKRDDA
jgi:hypothetical protein